MMKRQNVCPRNKTGVSSRLPPAANNQTFFFPSLFRSNFLCFDADYFSRRKKYYIFYEDLLTFLRMKIQLYVRLFIMFFVLKMTIEIFNGLLLGTNK